MTQEDKERPQTTNWAGWTIIIGSLAGIGSGGVAVGMHLQGDALVESRLMSAINLQGQKTELVIAAIQKTLAQNEVNCKETQAALRNLTTLAQDSITRLNSLEETRREDHGTTGSKIRGYPGWFATPYAPPITGGK